MECIGSKLQKQGVIMALFTLGLINTGCEDRIEGSVSGLPKGTPVDVELSFGFADEVDGASLCPPTDTRATATDGNDEAFSVQLVPTRPTKAGLDDMNTSKPDKLYNLEIWQFDRSGKKIGGQALAAELAIDAKLTVTLTANDDCQLLVVARGASGDIPTLNSSTYSNLTNIYTITQKALTSNINKCTSAVDGMKNMPYYLFLDHVKVIQESGSSNGTIQSPDGTERYDVRLMLKRLAVQLKVDWEFGGELEANGYTLKEVKLCQVPADYRLLQQTEQTETWGEVYPTSVANFMDYYRLKETGSDETLADANGTKNVWMPANARGVNHLVAGEKYRNKEYAEAAATYLEFVVYNKDESERTYFRSYLGGNRTTDFNLLENTNYYWKIKLNKIDYNDGRIHALTQTPVVSTNLQPTSNCFMMKPGTDICFNPYKHEAGTNGWNTYLTDGSGNIQTNKTIDNIKVLWQTKDAGTAGELVMGYSVSKDSHVNLVSLDNGDNSETARVNVKVAVSKGGNAVIAAYHQETIVWSWHLWISDYVPVGLKDFTAGDASTRQMAISTAQSATVGGTVNTYDGDGTTYNAPAWTQSDGAYHKSVIMDRNLGATRGTFSTASTLDAARAYGNIYQWGRKDPFTGSVDGSETDIDVLYDGDGNALSFKTNQLSGGINSAVAAREYVIQHPDVYAVAPSTSGSFLLPQDSWNTSTGSKAIYDPCPKGWRVPDYSTTDTKKKLFQAISGQAAGAGTLKFLRKEQWYTTCVSGNPSVDRDVAISNGFLYYPKTSGLTDDEKRSEQAAWFPAIRLREYSTGELRAIAGGSHVPSFAMWGAVCAGASASYGGNYMEYKINNSGNAPNGSPFLFATNAHSYGFSVRCIQDQTK